MDSLTTTEYRRAYAWYVQYPGDAYALGPYRYSEMVPATVPLETATKQFGEPPTSIWPTGPAEEIEEYEIELLDTGDE